MFKTKHFRMVYNEKEASIFLQRRICFIWITLYDEDNKPLSFKTVEQVDRYLNKEKRFGEIYIISYIKIKNSDIQE